MDRTKHLHHRQRIRYKRNKPKGGRPDHRPFYLAFVIVLSILGGIHMLIQKLISLF